MFHYEVCDTVSDTALYLFSFVCVCSVHCPLSRLRCAASYRLSVAMMHVLPAPVGVVASASQGSGAGRADALLSGWLGGYQGLEPGMLYYTNTFGELTAAGVFCGQQGTSTGMGMGGGVGGGDFYVQDDASDSRTLMTGLVGVAVSETTLLLKV